MTPATVTALIRADITWHLAMIGELPMPLSPSLQFVRGDLQRLINTLDHADKEAKRPQ